MIDRGDTRYMGPSYSNEADYLLLNAELPLARIGLVPAALFLMTVISILRCRKYAAASADRYRGSCPPKAPAIKTRPAPGVVNGAVLLRASDHALRIPNQASPSAGCSDSM
jgi:hypothetical protein